MKDRLGENPVLTGADRLSLEKLLGELDRQRAEVSFRLAHIAERDSRLTDAVRYLKAACQLDPTNSKYFLALDELDLRVSDRERASNAARQIDELANDDSASVHSPDDAKPARPPAGIARESNHRQAPASVIRESMLGRMPADGRSSRIDRLLAENRLDEARQEISKLKMLAPTDNRIPLLAGMLAAREGSLTEALRLLEQAVRADPNEPRALFEMGQAYERLNDLDRAEVCLRG